MYYVQIQRNTTYVIKHFEYENAVLSSRYFEHYTIGEAELTYFDQEVWV